MRIHQQQDPEYLRAKHAFIRDLIQFHESRGTGLQCDPKINGKEIDLYLLYQIVTSHGGWEKINLRNEWDKLLEHFKLPRSTNGGLAIKQIYLRYLELYEKIHYLGEDVDTKEEAEDEYLEDFRGRRRYPNKLVSSAGHYHHTPSSSNQPPKEIPDCNRSQRGLSSRILECSDYEGLLLSLQSPLPNEQDMAISVCTLLSNETKHVLRFSKSPAILNMLLAHAGIYQDCGMRLLMEETYKVAREMDYSEFWDEVLHQPDARQLLCECFVRRVNASLEWTVEEEEEPPIAELKTEPVFRLCCPSCPCQRTESGSEETGAAESCSSSITGDELSIQRPSSKRGQVVGEEDDGGEGPKSIPFTLARANHSGDKVGQRICQIAHILRNLSFEQDNAVIMAKSPTLMRFLLVAANCTFGSLVQASFDIIGNISAYLKLEEPLEDPLSSLFLTLVTSSVFASDRFKILRSLESMRELTRVEGNEEIIARYIESRVYRRMCDLLTLSDIMLLIYTLECILAMTGLGEAVCDEIVRVQGSVATLISLVTVEAQSYGPKGCILMRVVETVTGTAAAAPSPSSSSTTTSTTGAVPSLPPAGASSPAPAGTSSTVVAPLALPPAPAAVPSLPPPLVPTLPPTLPIAIQPVNQPPNTLATIFVQQPKNTYSTPVSQPTVVVPAGAVSTGDVVSNVTVNGAAASPIPPLLTANLPQISNHNLNQHHVVTPSISLVTPRGTLSEEAWAIAWLKGTFESASGTSIEQGEIYRMYSAARKNPAVVLSLEQFVQCVKCAYGASVGPVIKQFGGGTSLPFYEGIKPKISIRAVVGTTASGATAIKVAGPGTQMLTTVSAGTLNPTPQQITAPYVSVPTPNLPIVQTLPLAPPPAAVIPAVAPAISQDGDSSAVVVESNVLSNTNCNQTAGTITVEGGAATVPVSVNIPSREAKPSLSPILQATLSQPPKLKNNVAATLPAPTANPVSNSNPAPTVVPKRSKIQKVKENKKQSTGKSKKGAAGGANAVPVAGTAPTTSAKTGSKGKSTFSPASSAIRSLLASKVTQRQQNKLQQQVPKTGKNKLNANSLEDGGVGYPGEIVKVNGVGSELGLEKLEESSASSSILSSDGSENSAKVPTSLTSFHGVLHNGQANIDIKNEQSIEDDPEGLKNKASMKGMLIDLLERKMPREPVNGMMTGREIRISEKGLELIEKIEDIPVVTNHLDANTSSSTGSTCAPNDVQDSQKMTFYSSTSDAQVTLQGQAPPTACVIPASAVGSVLSGSAVTLASGGGGDSSVTPTSENTPLTLTTTCGQQVKFCGGKFLRLIEPISGGDGASAAATIATATLVAAPPLAAIAEIQSSTTATATAFNVVDGEGLVNSCPTAAASCSAVVAAAPPNGEVYFMSDDAVVGQIVEVVDTVIADDIANAADIGVGLDIAVADSICNVEAGDGEITFVVDGEGATSSCNISNNSSDTVVSNAVESTCSNGDGDLLDKFDEFSDLIVVPPEQLAGLKRPSSPLPTNTSINNNNNSKYEEDNLPPPAKKMAIDNTQVESETTNGTSNNNGCAEIITSSAGLHEQSGVQVVVSTESLSQAIQSHPLLVNSNHQEVMNAVTSAIASTVSTPSLPPGSGAQVVQLPLRLSVNPQNPQQLTFTRQLVLPTGQQLLLSTGNSQASLQGQMLISKTQGATSDQLPKAIIILQQQQQQPSSSAGNQTYTHGQPIVSTAQIQNIQTPVSVHQASQQPNMVMANTVVPATAAALQQATVPRPATMVAPNNPQVVPVQQHPIVPAPGIVRAQAGSMVQNTQTMVHQVIQAPLHSAVQQQLHVQSPQLQHVPHHQLPAAQAQALAAAKQQAMHCVQFEGIHSASYSHLTQDQLDLEFPFLCEWVGCGMRFLRPQQVSMHALKAHCPETLVDAVRCEWGQNGCDPLLRKRFSLMTHLQDRHCSKQALEMALYRRKNKIEPPPVPQQPVHHPGYAPNAAYHAIRRHAMSFMNTKEHLHDDNEGPVTKSIRLTSALILRNLVNFSSLGRRMLQGYESHLSAIAMSNVESSRTIAQLLHDMNDQPKSAK